MSTTTISPNDRAVGLVIREARQDLALTQAQLAAALGIAQNTLSQFERGQRSVTVAKLPELARALEISPGTLAKRIFEKISNCD